MDDTSHFETIRVERRGHVAWVTLNRPQKLNAIDATMLAELREALDLLAAEGGVRVSVLHGEGRCFSAGFDVGARPAGYSHDRDPADDARDLEARMSALMAVWDHPKPVIAAVHGYCLGAATALAVFCDLTVVADEAQIGLPSLPLGGGYLSPTWVHLVGVKRAKQMSFLAGSRVSGSTAAAWGWANHSVPAERLLDEAAELAGGIARTPGDVLALKKASLNRMVELSGLRAGAMAGAQTDALAHQSEGVRRLREEIARTGLKDVLARFDRGELEL